MDPSIADKQKRNEHINQSIQCLGTAAAAYAQSKFQVGQYYEVFEILQNELPEATFYEIAERVFAGGEQPAVPHRLLARISAAA